MVAKRPFYMRSYLLLDAQEIVLLCDRIDKPVSQKITWDTYFFQSKRRDTIVSSGPFKENTG